MKKYGAVLLVFLVVGCRVLNQPTAEMDIFNYQQEELDAENPALKSNNPALKGNNRAEKIILGTRVGQGNYYPYYNGSGYDFDLVVDLIFEKLLFYNDKIKRFEVVLAQEFPNVSDDDRTYHLRINPHAQFSNGTPLTAEDVLFSYQQISKPGYYGPYLSFLEDLEGFEDFSSGKTDYFSGIEIVSDWQINFTFKTTQLKNIMIFELPIISKSYYEEAIARDDLASLFLKPLGSGAYLLKAFSANTDLLLERNPSYWRSEKTAQVAKIEAISVNSQDDIMWLLAGEIDFLPGINSKIKIVQALESGFIERTIYKRAGYAALQFNFTEAKLQDINLRQALNYAFNRQLYQKAFLDDLALDLVVPINPNWLDFFDIVEPSFNYYSYNPTKAKELLAAAGWFFDENRKKCYNKNGEQLTIRWLTTKDSALTTTLTPILRDNLAEIGVNLQIAVLDPATLADFLYNKRTGYDIATISVFEKALPYDLSEHWHTKNVLNGGSNSANLRDAKNDALLDQFNASTTKAEAARTFLNWAIYFNELAPVIMLHSSYYFDLYNERLTNVATTSSYTWRHNLPEIGIKDLNSSQ